MVFTGHKYPDMADVTGDFLCAAAARHRRRSDRLRTEELDGWAGRLVHGRRVEGPTTWSLAEAEQKPEGEPRDVFAFVIHEGKVRAPDAAMALMSG